MKKILFCFFLLFLIQQSSLAQFGKLKDKIKQKVNQRVDQKTDNAIDKSLDKVEEGTKIKTESQEGDVKEKNENGEVKTSKQQGIKVYSKFDFVPGDKIVYAEDFAQDVIGEFPLKWNTNGTGEVVTLEKIPGKWLSLTAGTKYEAPYSNKLPDNYTVEFDLVMKFQESRRVPDMEFIISNKTKTTTPPGLRLFMAPHAGTFSSGEEQNSIDRFRLTSYNEKGERILEGKDQLNGEFYNHQSSPVHVAIWVQKERVRVWINQLKIYDLPKALAPNLALTNFSLETGSYGSEKTNYDYYFSNLKVAVATPDTRSKLITEGKWSTNGILFDINSDKIKPTSYGVLKEIASTLKENPDVKVKIIGHTDSDGDDAKNLDLSKRRAVAVKAALAGEFNIDASRMETDGKGESAPVADNKTSEGKAQNRRVEFIKM